MNILEILFVSHGVTKEKSPQFQSFCDSVPLCDKKSPLSCDSVWKKHILQNSFKIRLLGGQSRPYHSLTLRALVTSYFLFAGYGIADAEFDAVELPEDRSVESTWRSRAEMSS